MRRTGVVVWLDAPPSALAGRVGHERPLLAGPETASRLASILDRRRSLYEEATHFRVDADRPAPDVMADAARHARVPVGDSSEVLIGPGLPVRLLPASEHREKAVVIAQPGAMATARKVVERLVSEAHAHLIEVPDREEAKTLETLGILYARLADLNVGRHDTIVGVGGGATTDLAGFAAATWLRGIESVLVPTTLLGAVDASIGGKTGINVLGKNLVGAFWHPSRVVISTDVLVSLPEELLREGSAEAVKAGFIADPRLVEIFMEHGFGLSGDGDAEEGGGCQGRGRIRRLPRDREQGDPQPRAHYRPRHRGGLRVAPRPRGVGGHGRRGGDLGGPVRVRHGHRPRRPATLGPSHPGWGRRSGLGSPPGPARQETHVGRPPHGPAARHR